MVSDIWDLDDIDVSAGSSTLVDVAPSLAGRVYLHDVEGSTGSVRCWTYVSSGLLALGQSEVVITISVGIRDEGLAPTDPLRFMSTLQDLASRGQIVTAGDYTKLGGDGVLGRRGLAYVPAHPLPGVEIPNDALAALLMPDDELEVYEAFGASRLLALLGNAYRYYPFPPWSDISRASLTSVAGNTGSVRGSLARLTVPGTARMTGSHVRLRLPTSASGTVRAFLDKLDAEAEGPAPALELQIDPEADGLLLWQTGQQGPSAITPEGSSGAQIATGLIAFLTGQETDGGQIFEDGIFMFLTPSSWMSLREALVTGTPLGIAGADGRFGLELTFSQKASMTDSPQVTSQRRWRRRPS